MGVFYCCFAEQTNIIAVQAAERVLRPRGKREWQIESLLRPQVRAVSMIHTSRIEDNWTPKFLAVEQFIALNRCVMVYKIFSKLYPENLWNKYHLRSHYSIYNTRFCKNFQIPKYNLEYAKKGFSYSALKTWNEIPLSIRELPTLCYFKKQLKMYLMSWK